MSSSRDAGDPFPIAAVLPFTFDRVAYTAATPLTVPSDRVTATVSVGTLMGPVSFSPAPASALLLVATSHNVLYEPAGLTGSSYTISFSEPILELRNLYFATKDAKAEGAEVTLQAFLGAQLVGVAHARGTIAQGGVYTEGSLSFSGGLFDSLVVSVSPGEDHSELAIGPFDVAVLPDDLSFPLILDEPIGAQGTIDQSTVTVSGQLEDFTTLGAPLSYLLDGSVSGSVPVIPGPRSSSGSFSIILDGLAEGQHTLLLQAGDEAGHTTVKTLIFTVDLTHPTVSVDPIGLDGLLGSDTVTVTGAVADDVLLGGTVRYQLDGASPSDTPVLAAPDGTSGTFSLTLSPLTPGGHRLTIQGFDKAGNVVEVVVPFVYDATPPVITAPLGRDGFMHVTDPALSGMVDDAYGVPALLLAALDGADPVPVALDRSADLTLGQFSITTAGLNEGVHTLQLTASDRVGNTSTDAFTFVVDLTSPVLAFDPLGTQGYSNSATRRGKQTAPRVALAARSSARRSRWLRHCWCRASSNRS
jgi:hypothetical protein